MELAFITLSIGLIIFFAYVFSSIFERFQIPDVFFLLIIGLVLGPITGIVDVDRFGILGNLFATLTLLIILFEAGLDIKIKGLFSTASKAILLMTTTLVLSIAVVIPFAMALFELTLLESMLIGLIVGGVSAGIGIPLIKKLPVSEKTKSLLAIESNINDIVTVSIFFAIIAFLESGLFNAQEFVFTFGVSFLISLGMGALIAVVWSQILQKIRNIENNIFMTPALVLIVFGAAEIWDISGIIAVFAFGITLGNLQFLQTERIPGFLEFKEFFLTKWEKRMFSNFVFLLKTYFFVYIGLSISLSNMAVVLIGALITALLFGARYIAVRLSIGRDVPAFDRNVLARLVPKGLVGAALVTLVANQAVQNLSYAIILFSIVFTSILIPLLPKQESNDEEPDEKANSQPVATTS